MFSNLLTTSLKIEVPYTNYEYIMFVFTFHTGGPR